MSTSLTAYRPLDPSDDEPTAVVGLTGADRDGYPRDLDEQHGQLVRWFEESELSRQDEITYSERDRAYFNHDQWTKEERDELRKRGQPEIVVNKIHDKVNLLCGMERKARTDPKAFPRTPAEEDRADAATQALRYIADDNDFSTVRSLVFENMLVEGAGGAELGLEDDGKGGANVTITHVPWDRIWYDPHSRSPDFSDARYLGLVIWSDRDQLDYAYPDAQDVIENSFSPVDFYYNDRPETVNWTDNRRRRVRVVQCHWSERGTWWQATFTKAGLLAVPQRSRFKDRKGKSACSLLLQSAYIDRDNRRYGMVRGLISLQDEINKRRSKALHLLSVRQVVAEQGAVQDIDKARQEVAKPDGYVEVMPGLKFEIESGNDLATGQFQLLQHATAEMQLSGPNAAMSGTDPRELSGRAILAQQAGGSAQNEPLADSLRMWSRHVYEMAWMAAREYWTAGKWVRVTDDLNETRWVGINRQVRVMDALAEMPAANRAMVMQNMQLQPGDPRLQQVIRVENDITDLDVDITIAEGIDVPSIQAEQFSTLVQLAGMQPGLIPGDVLIAASGLKDKDMLLERMQEHQQAQAQQQQKAGQLAEAHAQADIQGKQAKAASDFALARERGVNAAAKVHDIHADFSAPPYGQPNIAPDNPPGTQGMQQPQPAPMVPHATGGLVTRTLPAETWRSQLPGTYIDTNGQMQILPNAPNFRAFGDPLNDTRDNAELNYESFAHPLPGWPGGGYAMPPQDWAGPPRSHATGGPINALSGPNPTGPDDGYITAKAGEYVLNRGAVAKYGQPLLDAINAMQIDPKVLGMASEHAAAQTRATNAKAAADEARAAQIPHQTVGEIANTHQTVIATDRLARTPIPQPGQTGA